MDYREDLAKNDLFQFETEEEQPIYDPYRTKNILKDMNCLDGQIFNKTQKVKGNKNVINCQPNTQQNSNNYRRSLKKLLEKLEAIPSPQKQMKINKENKTLDILSCTQPVISRQQKKQKFKRKIDRRNSQKQSNNERLFENSMLQHLEKDSKLQVNNRPLKTMTSSFSSNGVSHSCKKTMNSAHVSGNQERVRKLIKQKIAEKNMESKYKKKSNLLNFLRENNSSQLERKKKANVWENPRKLTNILLFQ